MERLWTKPFISMTAAMLVLLTGFYLLLPTLPLFIKELGGSEAQIGLTTGAFTLSAVLFRPIVGGLLDRYGRKPFIICGLLLFALSMYAYSWIGGIAALIILRIVHGMSWAVSTTAVGTALTDRIPAARRGEGMGWYGMAMTVAMAIGPALGVWILENRSFHGLFLTAALLSSAAFVFMLFIPAPFRRADSRRRIVFFERSVLPLTVTVFFFSVSYGGITTFLPLFAETIRVNAGVFFSVYAVTLTIVRPISGKWSDRRGPAFVIVPSLAVTALALAVLGLSVGLAGVIAAAVLFGAGFGSAQPALQSAVLRLAHPERQGAANASFFTAFDLGIGLGSIVLGAVSPWLGYQGLFGVSALSVVIALLLFAFVVRQSLGQSEPAS